MAMDLPGVSADQIGEPHTHVIVGQGNKWQSPDPSVPHEWESQGFSSQLCVLGFLRVVGSHFLGHEQIYQHHV